MASRTIVVGDIHGCYDELMKLLKKAKFKQSDRVVSVGDLVSKGPKVREVLDPLYDGQEVFDRHRQS
jgi:Icc-related predicted phosphoesterase